jgi:hypothetical protein
VVDLPTRDDREGWWHLLKATYEQHRRPEWRNPLPKGTPAKSQSVLWAVLFSSPHGADIKDSGQRMAAFLEGFGRFLEHHPGDARSTVWTLLDSYAQGPGTLQAATPEAAVRDALKSVPRDVALRLLLRLAAETAEGMPRR